MADGTAITKAEEKSWVRSWVDRARGEVARAAPSGVSPYVKETGSVLGQYGEAAVTGALIGAADALYPGAHASAAVAALGALVAVGGAGVAPGVAAVARNVGANAFAILNHDAVKNLVAGRGGGGGGPMLRSIGKSGGGGAATNGEIVDDPVVRTAAGLKS
jgi:hypothetical protein